MGYLHGNSNRSGIYTCQHNHDISKSPCPLCEEIKKEETRLRKEQIVNEMKDREVAEVANRIPVSEMSRQPVEIDDYMEGWVSYAQYEQDCPGPVYDLRTNKIYPELHHDIGSAWR